MSAPDGGAPRAARARRLTLPLWLAVLLAGAALAQQIGAAAWVNGVTISLDRLQKSVDAYVQQTRSAALGNTFDPGRYQEVRRHVLDILIGEELLWQAAKAKGMVVPDEQVERAVAEARARFETERMFQSKLAERGLDVEGFAEDIRHRLSVQRFIAEEVFPSVEVSDEEIHQHYETNRLLFTRPPMVRARHILLTMPRGATREQQDAVRERIGEILAEARGGADFAELAKRYSEDSSAERGGDLGFFAKEQMTKAFSSAAFALQPGEISEPVRTRYGYHIIKLEARRDGGLLDEAEAREQIRRELLISERDRALTELVQRLREAAEVKIFISF